MEFGGWRKQSLLRYYTGSNELGCRAEASHFVGRHFGDDQQFQRTELHQHYFSDRKVRASAAVDWPVQVARQRRVLGQVGIAARANWPRAESRFPLGNRGGTF